MNQSICLLMLSGAVAVPAATGCGLPARPGSRKQSTLPLEASATWGSSPVRIASPLPGSPVRIGPAHWPVPVLFTHAYQSGLEVS